MKYNKFLLTYNLYYSIMTKNEKDKADAITIR